MKIRITSGDPGAPVQTLVRSSVFGKAEDANDSRTGHQKRTHHPVCLFFVSAGIEHEIRITGGDPDAPVQRRSSDSFPPSGMTPEAQPQSGFSFSP